LFVSYAQGVPLPQSLNPAAHWMPQPPWLQVAVPPLPGTGHMVQLEPQCVGSPSVSKQVPPQLESGDGQAQWEDWQVMPPLQAVMQSPQWPSSELRFEHELPQSVVPEGQPLAQAYVLPASPVAAAHTGVPEFASQAVLHPPQWVASLRSVSQTSPGLLEQCA
jgi:hypothetical protein